jgi:hypothetical protein
MVTTTTLNSTTANPTTYGQAVQFTAEVKSAGGVPTGSIELFDGTRSLGTYQLTGGPVTVTTGAISVGTPGVTAHYRPTGEFAPSVSGVVARTVNKATAASTFSPSPISVQYSDTITFSTTLTAGPAGGDMPAQSATFRIGTAVIGTAQFVPASGGVVRATWTGQLLETFGLKQLGPGAKTVAVLYNEVSPNFTVTNRFGSMTIVREDATASYVGPTALTTTTTTTAVPLKARIVDMADGLRGDPRNATVTFVNRTTGLVIGTASIALETPEDPTTAVASFTWNVNTTGSVTAKIGIVVNGYYNRNNLADDGLLTITKR